MNITFKHVSAAAAFCAAMLICTVAGFGQISPNEIADPQLKAAEQAYLPKLIAINREIETTKFPFLFSPNRYLGLEPKDQAASDRRGLEFVSFHGRSVLKLTGNYNAAYNANLLTANQRANKTFDEVIQPILRLLPAHFSSDDTFDAFGFVIAYHVRTNTNAFGYEGKENLVVVMDKIDAFHYIDAKDDADRQRILNRGEVFLNGKPFGLQRGLREPFILETLNRSLLDQRPISYAAPATPKPDAPKNTVRVQPEPKIIPAADTAAQADAEKLQEKYQSQLDAFAADGTARFHFVQYPPPSVIVFRNQLSLQLTVRNAEKFEKESTSIYKRAAQSFDLFLAPQLKGILEKLPSLPGVKGVSVAILNEVTSKSVSSNSEALEFFFPLAALRQFVDAEITNQELINQSAVLVNGVRIALDLQRVE
jgi:hypothetical protein